MQNKNSLKKRKTLKTTDFYENNGFYQIIENFSKTHDFKYFKITQNKGIFHLFHCSKFQKNPYL